MSVNHKGGVRAGQTGFLVGMPDVDQSLNRFPKPCAAGSNPAGGAGITAGQGRLVRPGGATNTLRPREGPALQKLSCLIKVLVDDFGVDP